MSITDNKAHLKVSFVYNRKGLYQAYRVELLNGKVRLWRGVLGDF